MVATTDVSEECQYLHHLGLSQNPFPVAPDDDNFYLSAHIDQILTNLVHGIMTRKGFMVLTGDIGLGKTTISRRIIRILEKKGVETSLVFHTNYRDVELLREINRDFGLHSESLLVSEQMKCLNEFLLAQNSAQKNCAIIIDDAQNLDHTSLELIRMISNLETHQQKLVQILLIGQPELAVKLRSKKLRQLDSRIVIKETVRPLESRELKHYLKFKLTISGGNGSTRIEPAAVRSVYKFTRGNFRKVNLVMDRCLYLAYFNDTQSINVKIAKEAMADLSAEWRQPRNSRRVMLAAALGLLVLAAGAWLGSRYWTSAWTGFAEVAPQNNASMRIDNFKLPNPSAPVPQRAANASLTDHHAGVSVPKPVNDFLSAYGLSHFAGRFVEALKQQQYHDLSASIYAQTGYELIRLKHLPANIPQQYGILSYPTEAKAPPDHFLFWRPKIVVDRFYYAYRGAEIFKLQQMLSKSNFYRSHLDGIVGKKLMQAIVSFQKQAGLPVSGYPDKQTLFLLAHQIKG